MGIEKAVLALLISGSVLVLGACAGNGETPVSGSDLLAMIESGEAPAIIDVRSTREFETGHVPGAVHIPFWSVYARRFEVPARTREPVVVYCAHGPRAGIANLMLRIAGFEQVLYLQGHMSGWYKAGLPVAAGG